MLRRDDCQLRPVLESDLGLIRQWRNSERIRANMFTDHIISSEEHLAADLYGALRHGAKGCARDNVHLILGILESRY